MASVRPMRNHGPLWATFGPGSATRGFSTLAVCLVGFTAACGEEDNSGNGNGTTPVDEDQVQDYLGLRPGSCFLYEYTIPGSNNRTTTEVAVTEPPDFQFPGRNAAIWELDTNAARVLRIFEFRVDELLQLEDRRGSPLIQRQYYDPADPGNVAQPQPRWTRLQPPLPGEDELRIREDVSGGINSAPTPVRVLEGQTEVENPHPEVHRWLVRDRTMVSVPAGTFDAIPMTYQITRDGDSEQSEWELAPGIGWVRFTDFTNIEYRLQDYSVLRADGSRVGNLTCSN